MYSVPVLAQAKQKVSFTIDQHGKPLAYRVSYEQMRNFRISLDKAKLMVATGEAIETTYRPFGKYAA